jgi:putative serine protease PepD
MKAVKPPRHIWSGDWWEESDRARQEAEEQAAALREEARRRAEAARPLPPPQPRRFTRKHKILATALVASTVTVSAFAVGTLVGGGTEAGPDPLPAVSDQPLKPRVGQTRAGLIYAHASPAVVSIRTGSGSGTGFLIDSEGRIVTNAHVVGSNSRVLVRFGQDQTSLDGKVVGSDPSSDIAVVDIGANSIPKGVKPLEFSDSRAVQVGDVAIAIGNPFGLDRTATEGIVSGLGREIKAPNGFQIDSVIQTDAPINPGNSGGPLLDDAGHVIGVNSQIATAGAGGGNLGIGFAVPSNTAREVVPQLEQGKVVKRAYLGVESSADPTSPNGAEIQSVVPGGPADKAGLTKGDLVKSIDGTAVKDPSDVSSAIATKEPGDKITVRVERNGLTEEIDVTLGTRPRQTP